MLRFLFIIIVILVCLKLLAFAWLVFKVLFHLAVWVALLATIVALVVFAIKGRDNKP